MANRLVISFLKNVNITNNFTQLRCIFVFYIFFQLCFNNWISDSTCDNWDKWVDCNDFYYYHKIVLITIFFLISTKSCKVTTDFWLNTESVTDRWNKLYYYPPTQQTFSKVSYETFPQLLEETLRTIYARIISYIIRVIIIWQFLAGKIITNALYALFLRCHSPPPWFRRRMQHSGSRHCGSESNSGRDSLAIFTFLYIEYWLRTQKATVITSDKSKLLEFASQLTKNKWV